MVNTLTLTAPVGIITWYYFVIMTCSRHTAWAQRVDSDWLLQYVNICSLRLCRHEERRTETKHNSHSLSGESSAERKHIVLRERLEVAAVCACCRVKQLVHVCVCVCEFAFGFFYYYYFYLLYLKILWTLCSSLLTALIYHSPKLL